MWQVSSPQPRPISSSINSKEYAKDNQQYFSHTIGRGVCRDLFEIGKTSTNMTEFMVMAVNFIRDTKELKEYMLNVYYDVIGYSSPHMVRILNGSSAASGVAGTNVSIVQGWRLEQLVEGRLAHLSCRLRMFGAREVEKCMARRPRNITRITYIGDSRIRMHVEMLLDLLRPLNPTVTTSEGRVITVSDFLGDKGQSEWKKYKRNFVVECSVGLVLEFRWAPFLHSPTIDPEGFQSEFKMGGLKFLEDVANAETDKLPDLLLLGRACLTSADTGAWQLHDIKVTVLQQIDLSGVVAMKTLDSVLSRLAQRTTVVWALPDPFKDHIFHDFSRFSHYTQQTSMMLEWLLNAQLSFLPPGVIIWDSFLPVAYASITDCINIYMHGVNISYLPEYSNFEPSVTWQCFERMHIGLEAISVAVQMVLNHICNPFMDEAEFLNHELKEVYLGVIQNFKKPPETYK
ncbi:hypothetical protein Pmani_027134 [Petrolisthes manimaculis]|uniref:Uncharacterized protein n=1 Tax=Petrolisthes manimaculis TaxID=1843537 RepID=A0AAE1TX67_9EUCA|nr:hypothetical protein Pmani_027134 [Petrolisthes manimaculis]